MRLHFTCRLILHRVSLLAHLICLAQSVCSDSRSRYQGTAFHQVRDALPPVWPFLTVNSVNCASRLKQEEEENRRPDLIDGNTGYVDPGSDRIPQATRAAIVTVLRQLAVNAIPPFGLAHEQLARPRQEPTFSPVVSCRLPLGAKDSSRQPRHGRSLSTSSLQCLQIPDAKQQRYGP